MNFTYGFYDSENGDRKYYTRQMSSLFDGIILDGVFMTIGNQLRVRPNPDESNGVIVSAGKAWFNHTWSLLDSDCPISCDPASNSGSRYDAVVLEVDEPNRTNSILVLKGEAVSKDPKKPSLTRTDKVHQYALCYIYRPAGSVAITAANIENMVGTTETPFVSGPLKGIDMDELLGQWRAQLDEFVASEEQDLEEFMSYMEYDYSMWLSNEQAKMSQAITDQQNWTAAQQAAFETWFNDVQVLLSDSAGGAIVLRLSNIEIENILMYGLPDGKKTFSADGTTSTTVAPRGLTLTKTFTNNFLTSASVLTDGNGVELGRLVKTFSEDGSVVDSSITTMYSTYE